MRSLAAIVAGAALLAWPAALNGYPLVFIDTVSYLGQTVFPETPWDKTQAYGLFLHAFHWRISLWPAVAVQALIASHLTWLAQRMVRGEAAPGTHMLVCAALAALTAAPWTLATLMPDALTGLGPLCLILLGFARLSRIEATWVALVGAVALASHLSHLPGAVALLMMTALLTRRLAPTLRVALPLALALAFLAGSNLVSFGRATLSPHGAVFLLARLQDDGPAAALLSERCPAAGWHLCAFTDRLPMDSDEFLWSPDSPLNRNADGSPRPMGGVAGAVEAREIIAATLRAHPLEVALAMLRNTARQAVLTWAGDTLVNEHLDLSARRAIAAGLRQELADFDTAAQMQGTLPARAAPFLALHAPVLALCLLALPWLAWRAIRARDLPRIGLLAGMLVALLANAAATGALSKPHERYQARIVWLLPLAVMLAAPPPQAARREATSSGGIRTSAS
ncbi:hypothetical protein [Falsiroseomonas sp. HW251]|uniref:hypothetical protein n=1 Tax=Falsiroseomonas sp. HW251 TaxID=3390998 RepID=UPI003D3153D3